MKVLEWLIGQKHCQEITHMFRYAPLSITVILAKCEYYFSYFSISIYHNTNTHHKLRAMLRNVSSHSHFTTKNPFSHWLEVNLLRSFRIYTMSIHPLRNLFPCPSLRMFREFREYGKAWTNKITNSIYISLLI